MRHFSRSFVIPFISGKGYRRICEIGSSRGNNTDKLLELPSISLSIIDPCIDDDLVEKYGHDARVKVYQGRSLDVLPSLDGQFDCILIDGDHNWFTVFHELTIIANNILLSDGGTIFFHDVGWPYGRRDMYYSPETIPADYRQPYEKRGLLRESVCNVAPPFNSEYCNAISEGGPRNGVLTAIEDFLAEHRDAFKFTKINEEHGLGILVKCTRGYLCRPYLKLLAKAQLVNFKEGMRAHFPYLFRMLARTRHLPQKFRAASRTTSIHG